MWSNAVAGYRTQSRDRLQNRTRQLLVGLRVDLTVAVWAESSRLQTRVLGQGSGTRSMDEQVRSDHDVPADGTPTGGHAPPHLPNGERHYHAVYDERLRRRKQGIPRDSNRRPQAQPTEGDRGYLHGIYRGALGGRHAGARSEERRGGKECEN